MNKIVGKLVSGALLAGCALAVSAEQWSIQYGLGAAHGNSLYKGAPDRVMGLPYINAEYGRWKFGVDEGIVNYRITPESSDFKLSVGLGFRDETYGSDFLIEAYESDDPIFFGYKSPDEDYTATAKLEYSRFSLGFAQDISESSQGLEVDLSVNLLSIPLAENIVFETTLGARWLSKKYVDHVYGINQQSVSSLAGRTYYLGDDAINTNLSSSFIYGIDKRWSVISGVTYQQIDDSIFDSPLVDQDYSYSAFVLFVYEGI